MKNETINHCLKKQYVEVCVELFKLIFCKCLHIKQSDLGILQNQIDMIQ